MLATLLRHKLPCCVVVSSRGALNAEMKLAHGACSKTWGPPSVA